MEGACWAVAREFSPGRSWQQRGTWAHLGEAVVIGRDGHLPLGITPEDGGVSRAALRVTATQRGWQIENNNRNGALLHPWGLAASLARPHTLIDWPLVAIRVIGSDGLHQHWVLLESNNPRRPVQPSLRTRGKMTGRADAPKALTPAETEALWTVFMDLLAWPPRKPALPLQLKQAARQLRITDSAVQLRLEGAQRKALALGLSRAVRLTEPDYLHVLVAAGYITPPLISPVRAGLTAPDSPKEIAAP